MLRRLLTVLASFAMLASGCSSSSDDRAADSVHAGKSPSGRTAAAGVSIELGDAPGPLLFAPSAPQVIPVRVSPPGTYTVRFALVGDVRDAYLDTSESDTDETGTTSVTLTAPSSPATFRLRASVAGASAEVVASADKARTQITVVPAYAGARPIAAWFATVDTGSHCDPLAPVPPPDGPLYGEAEFGQPIPVHNVPVDAALRVTVRAGQFAGGCTEVPAFAVDKLRSISVTVIDRPMQMTSVSIPVSLGIDQSGAWVAAWSSLTDRMIAAAMNGATSDADALLTDMNALTPYLVQDAFEDDRARFHWTDRVASILSHGSSPNGISDTLRRWLTDSLTPLATGAISGTLTSPPIALGGATLAVDDLAGTDPAASGFPAVVALTWAPAADDQLLFGGAAWWKPSRLAAALALVQAKKQVTAADSVSNALARSLSCADVGSLIAKEATAEQLLGCGSGCMTSRCEQALDAMWDRAQRAAQDVTLVHVSGTGAARIDDNARPMSFIGTWVGDASLGSALTRVTGPATGGETTTSAR